MAKAPRSGAIWRPARLTCDPPVKTRMPSTNAGFDESGMGAGGWLVRRGGRDDCLPRDMVTPEPRRESSPPARSDTVSRGTAWAVGLFAALVLSATTVASMGLAAFVWVPLLAMIGGVMCTVWAARRRRQTREGRSASDIKDSLHAPRPWPTKGITDDRLLP